MSAEARRGGRDRRMGVSDDTGIARLLRIIALPALVAGFLAGCAAPLIAERYSVGIAPRQIVLACRDVYEVYDRADAETLLVTTSVGTEASASICSGELTKEQRLRAAAERFLVETKKPRACRLLSGVDLSPAHAEYGYRCG